MSTYSLYSLTLIYIEEAYSKGVISYPPPYNEGDFCNKYITLTPEEKVIFEHKRNRVDPAAISTARNIMSLKLKDKKFVKTFKKKVKFKRIEDVTEEQFVSNVFLDIASSPDDLLDMNYFSQYISELGFKFTLDMVFNCTPGNIYVALCSINPPGSMYRNVPSYEKVIVFNEINYDSYLVAQRFTESFYMFKNVPVDYKTHMIIDIKSVKFKKNGATEINDFAWTIYPLFTTLDVDENRKTVEMFVRSGIYMMPLFTGAVREDVVNKLKDQDDSWEFLTAEDKRKVSSVSFMQNSGVVVRCIDNQREGHYLESMDVKRISYNF